MLEIAIPGWRSCQLTHLVLDVNGTLAVDGILLPDVQQRLAELQPLLQIHLLSADTHGRLDEISRQLGQAGTRLRSDESEVAQKAAYIRELGASSVVAIGNGANDVSMLRDAAIGIAVVGGEGLAVGAIQAADVVTFSVLDALDLLIKPRRIIATLRR